MRRIRMKHVDAFTDRTFGENPAAVVPSAEGLSDHEMQSIANKMNLSETVFNLTRKQTSDYDGSLQNVRFSFVAMRL